MIRATFTGWVDICRTEGAAAVNTFHNRETLAVKVLWCWLVCVLCTPTCSWLESTLLVFLTASHGGNLSPARCCTSCTCVLWRTSTAATSLRCSSVCPVREEGSCGSRSVAAFVASPYRVSAGMLQRWTSTSRPHTPGRTLLVPCRVSESHVCPGSLQLQVRQRPEGRPDGRCGGYVCRSGAQSRRSLQGS